MGKSAPRGPQPGDVSGGSASGVPVAKGPSAMAAEKHALDLLVSSSLTSWRHGVSAQGAKGRGRTDGGWAGRQRGDGDGDGDGDRPWGGKTAGRQGLGEGRGPGRAGAPGGRTWRHHRPTGGSERKGEDARGTEVTV